MMRHLHFIAFLVCLLLVPLPIVSADDWKEYKQTHFIIYYKDAPKDFVKTVEDSAEKYYNEIARNLGFTRYKGWTWEERAKIYIYDDQETYISSGQAGWSHGAASPERKIIKTFPAAHGFFDSTLPHEIGHLVFREFIGYDTYVPRWFEEGVAMQQEKAKRWGAHKQVQKYLKDNSFRSLSKLGVGFLRRATQEDVELFYTESASIVSYLIQEHGKHRFSQFCRKLKSGTPFEIALGQTYSRFDSIEKLNEAWVKFLKK